jgi:hypothetical protein
LPETVPHTYGSRRWASNRSRATVAASVLLANGFTQVDVFLGSMGAWEASEQATVTPEPDDSRESTIPTRVTALL